MKNLKLATLLIVMTLLSFTQIVNAGFASRADINDVGFSCNNIRVNITIEGGVSYSLTLTNVTTGATFSSGTIVYSGASTTTTVSITYSDDDFAAGDSVALSLRLVDGHMGLIASEDRFFTANCDSENEGEQYISLCDDGRININLCEPVAIYPVIDDEGVHMVVYNVESGDDIGEFAFFLDAETLSDMPDDNLYPIEITRSEDDFAILYWMPNGHYQVNAGPDFEGKVFTFAFETFPDQIPSVTTFYSATNEIPTS